MNNFNDTVYGQIYMVNRICEKAIAVSKLARAHFSSLSYGVVPSKIKGPGFEYVDLREYSPGDDIRFIDWRASARMVKAEGDYRIMVKEFLLERMVNVVMILDYTSSMDYGDKIETAIYALTGLLSIAHSVGDIVDLLIIKGEKPVIKYGLEPLDAINLALNTICRSEPRGKLDLTKISGYIEKLRNREAFFIITDYAHYPIEFEALATRISALKTVLGTVLIATPIEVKKPGFNGFYEFIDIEYPVKKYNIELSKYYEKVKKHINKIKAVLLKMNIDYVEIIGLEQARVRKLKLIKLYSLTRLRKRVF